MKKIVFRLEEEMIKDLKRIAVEKEWTMSKLFVEGIEEILKKYHNLVKK